MLVWRLVVAVALTAAAFPLTVDASDACEPYPVGRCGAYDREMVTFCYRMAAGRMVDATDTNVIALGTSEGVSLPANNAKGVAYLRMTPLERFAEDPYESDPFDSVVIESNNVRGVQLAPFKCATFIWYAECDSWMGPYNILPLGAAMYAADSIAL